MNPDDDDSVINQLKHPRFMLDIIPKLGVSFVKSIENRRYRQSSRPENDLQVYAEDELIRKQFKELVSNLFMLFYNLAIVTTAL